MRGMGGMLARGLFYLLAVVLLVWTSSLTVAFVRSALPGSYWLVPYLALVQFDVGQVAWLFVFMNQAQGSGQRAVSLAACVLDFLGVGLMVLAEILLGGQSLAVAPEGLATAAIWGLGLWSVANVGAVILFHLLDPETRREMAVRVEVDAVFDEALRRLGKMRAENSAELAQQLAEGMMHELRTRLGTGDHSGRLRRLPEAISTESGGDLPTGEPFRNGQKAVEVE